jgi:hypothetical protein
MVAVDAANIHVNGQTASSLQNTEQYRIYASNNADSLTISYGVEFSKNNNANACDTSAVGSNPNCEVTGLTVDLTDNQNHEGRQIAIPKTVVDEATGGNPGLVQVKHESGTQYMQPVETHGDYYVFKINEFSTNTVTFSGETQIDANPGVDGAEWSYNISDKSSVDDFQINVTGHTSFENDTETASGLTDGSSMPVNVAGTNQPTGHSTTEPQLTVTGKSGNASDYTGTAATGTLVGGDAAQGDIEVAQSPPSIDGVWIYIAQADPDVTADIYIAEEPADGVGDDGTQVASGYVMPDTAGWHYIPFDSAYSTNSSGTEVSVGFNVQSTTSASDNIVIYHDGSGSGQFQSDMGTYGTPSMKLQTPPKDVTVTADTGQSVNVGALNVGETQTHAINIDKSTSSLDVSATQGKADLELAYREGQKTVDPSVTVNGNTVDYVGTLQDGETVSLTAYESWLVEGENTVSLDVGDGSETSDTPALTADLNYTHQSSEDIRTDYDGEKWSERYDVSKTYGTDTNNAKLTIPFSGNVVEIRNVEYRVNDGSWQSPSYSLNDTSMTVTLGDMAAGDTVEVRATGSKVVVANGSVTVTDPTVMGNSLDTGIRLDSWNSGSYIAVGGTPDGSRVHTTYNESWTDAASFSEVTADSNKLFLPNAAAGGTTQVTVTSLEVTPESNDVRVEVTQTGKPMKFEVKPGDWGGDKVTYTYHNTVSGEDYVLYSVTNDVQLDSATAQSPVTLSDDDSSAVLKIFEDTETSSTDDGGDSGGYQVPIGPIQNDDSGIPDTAIMLAIAVVALVGLYTLQKRVFNEGNGRILGVLPRSPLFLTGGGLVAFVTIDYASGNAITTAVGSGLAQVMPVLGLLGGALAAYYLYKRFILGQDTKIVVRGSKK